jgi:spore coat polysaccharide biosynthesis protein SpsF (cytidylyltransferase family)
MNIANQTWAHKDVIVRVRNSSGKIDDIIIRNTLQKQRLEGKDYFKYRIISPEGFEGEEIFHRLDRGTEALLAVVFMILAEASRCRQS